MQNLNSFNETTLPPNLPNTMNKGRNHVLEDILKSSKIDMNDIGEIVNPPAGKATRNASPGTDSFLDNSSTAFDDANLPGIDLDQLQEIGKLKKTALLHYRNKKPLEALKVLEQAILLLPGDLELIYYEALCLFQLGNFDRVSEILTELEKLDEEKVLSGLGKIRAMCMLRTKKYSVAETYLRELLTTSKNDRQLLNMLAYSLERQDKLNDAKIILQRILDKDEFNTNACNTLAYVLFRLGENLNKALELIRKALNSEPENPLYLDTLGMILNKKGQKLQALQAIKKAMFFDPKNPEIKAHFEEVSKDIPRH